MAEKSNEKYPCENNENSSETAIPYNIIADKNDEDTSGTICTISSSSKNIPEVFLSFDDEQSSELDALQPSSSMSRKLSMKNIVGKFFDNKYKSRNNDNVVENDNNNPVDINNELNVYAPVDDIQHNMLANICMIDSPSSCPSMFINYIHFPELCLSINEPFSTYSQLPLSVSLTPPLNLDVSVVKHGQEYIDFMSIFTEFDIYKPLLEKIFSYLAYRDIASMTAVSKTWRKAVSKSVTAQKKLEKVFIHAILYFCHNNANVTDEYKQLFNKILIHFKNQIHFKRQDF
ncbi:uncharacterized protein LOC113559176 [Rhopalosiphum maidis]|uniref:uncharacterized protein LOC113559176 n=1 Tax=Rhopalosiphum maidis TaxID=43146 RepID=UPI000F002F3A|nr:uncharacterized protein LOC113559176 [Rhopalosiphum maidis]